MELTAILALIREARSVIDFGVRQAAIAYQQGKATEQQLNEVRKAAELSDANFDLRVAEAKARLAAGAGR